MKPIKITNQKLLNLADKMRRSDSAMNHWTDIAMHHKQEFWDALKEKYGDKLDQQCIYDYVSETVRGSQDLAKLLEKNKVVKT